MEIRKLERSDLSKLSSFFKLAYGSETIFSDIGYLEWYFRDKTESKLDFQHTGFIALDSGKIVSHYGLLQSSLIFYEQVVPIYWMVSAFTLPEFRSYGLNSKIIKSLMSSYDNLGVISFPKKALSFYEKLGFNTFGGLNFDRYIRNLSEKSFEIVELINQNSELAKASFPVKAVEKKELSLLIVEIGKDNVSNYNFELPKYAHVTCNRNVEYYQNRFINHPYINYTIYAAIENRNIIGVVVSRIETLNPTDKKVNRLVDLYGSEYAVEALLEKIQLISEDKKLIYIDFSCFGKLYQDILISLGFTKLQSDEESLLPQVTFPIESRPNLEFVSLYSKTLNVRNLNTSNVYFTRADSDRDRLNRIGQLNS